MTDLTTNFDPWWTQHGPGLERKLAKAHRDRDREEQRVNLAVLAGKAMRAKRRAAGLR